VQALEKELKNYETVWKQFTEREATPEQVCHASARLLMAQQHFRKKFDFKLAIDERMLARLKDELGFDLKDPKSEYQAHLDRLKKVEEITRARAEAGAYSPLEHDTATFYRLVAEDWLAQKKTFAEAVLDPGPRSKE
jgi:hypothetical protein